jgi:CRISPR-associated protein Csx14
MTHPTPSITVNVDVSNPGQFLACCGLLELADRLWPGAEGWFESSDDQFHLTCDGTLSQLLNRLVEHPPIAIERLDCNGLNVAPIIAPLAFVFDSTANHTFVLDAWTRIALIKGEAQVISNPPWNFWSGQQTSMRIWTSLRGEFIEQLKKLPSQELGDLFSYRLMQKGRFGFDPGPAWNALDVGFSLNEHGIEVESSPATELLAAIGLQRFRPSMNSSRDRFDYCTWHRAFSPSVAAAAMGSLDRRLPRYRATVTTRGQYAALGFAYPLKSGDNHVQEV